MKKTKSQEKVTRESEIIVSEEGELLGLDERKILPVGKEPPYYKVYLQDIANIFGLTPAEQAVFKALCANMSFKNTVVLIKPIKDILVEMTGYGYETIRKTIQELANKKLLLRQARAVYLVNPNYAAKGSWEEIRAMRLIIDYSEKGRKIEVKKINRHEITIEEKKHQQLDLF